VDKVKALIHEGNVRRVVVQHEGRTVAEFPLTAGIVGAVLAPVVAAVGALVAVLEDCTIQVERENQGGARLSRLGGFRFLPGARAREDAAQGVVPLVARVLVE
jgi:hypothetical protein